MSSSRGALMPSTASCQRRPSDGTQARSTVGRTRASHRADERGADEIHALGAVAADGAFEGGVIDISFPLAPSDELDEHILRSSCPAGVCRPVAVASGAAAH